MNIARVGFDESLLAASPYLGRRGRWDSVGEGFRASFKEGLTRKRRALDDQDYPSQLRCGGGGVLLAQRTAADIKTLPDRVQNTAVPLAFPSVHEHEPRQARQAAR